MTDKAMRIGIIGLGNMGAGHARYLAAGEVAGGRLTAVCDPRVERAAWAKEQLGSEVAIFAEPQALLDSGLVDGVVIATPHYDHPITAQMAFARGLHVLCEKPAGVATRQVRQMNEAAQAAGTVFSMVYNQRTNPLYAKVKDLVAAGELGAIRRTNWIITNWYRAQSYYNSGGWRATWAGEGGGVLINQAPHQIDLWQWTIGMMPTKVRAFCHFGKYHQIEVEDDVTAYVEYGNGATGLFVTSTGEAPGTNRLELVGDRGKIVVEDGKLSFWRLRVPEPEFNRSYTGLFGQPECWKCEVPIEGEESGHKGIMQNWVDAVLHGAPLIAPGEEGIRGLTLSNAMLLSTWTDNWVDLPIDEELFEHHLQERIQKSKLEVR
ncbi:Gfo/Idh/MocA family oxidoreductase [Paenibacillus athensensis]|uniref:Oxidoreductase n=1 Tax=Paenibacillus athensensis TaxID=1967502 RepID=A0A4Y8PUB7_9BACL|nr:Gfo/Idh/MocA family oxidoreductase [Paenibacillus athensensis]MCD1257928.1 Gfo/Idh/MocA family oxidoreductase [Paenibacillus athensensis]